MHYYDRLEETMRSFRLGPLCGMVWAKGGWFRLFGYGLHIQDARGYVRLFSERYGYRRAHYFGRVRLMFLSPKSNVI